MLGRRSLPSVVLAAIVAVIAPLTRASAASAAAPQCGVGARVVTGALPRTRAPAELASIDRVSPTDAWAVGDASERAWGERWDGAQWRRVPFAQRGSSVLLGVDAVSDAEAWAVGGYDDGFGHHAFSEHWDGTSWTIVDVFNEPFDLNAVAEVTPTDVWAAGGGPRALHWDGSSWTSIPLPPTEDGEVHAIAVLSADDIWVAGTEDSELGGGHPFVAHWDGTFWTRSPVPPIDATDSEIFGLAAISGDDIWAVGEADSDAGHHSLLLHWNGRAWHEEPAPDPGSVSDELVGAASSSDGDAWAIGSTDDGTAEHPYALRLIDGRWMSVPVQGAPDSTGGALTAVAAGPAGDVWAAGASTDPDGTSAPLLEHPADVSVSDDGFSPATCVTNVGATVFWSIDAADAARHSLTDRSGSGFDSGPIPPGGLFAHAFDQPGTHRIVDQGTAASGRVVVRAAAG